jgi:hypothetical protein
MKAYHVILNTPIVRSCFRRKLFLKLPSHLRVLIRLIHVNNGVQKRFSFAQPVLVFSRLFDTVRDILVVFFIFVLGIIVLDTSNLEVGNHLPRKRTDVSPIGFLRIVERVHGGVSHLRSITKLDDNLVFERNVHDVVFIVSGESEDLVIDPFSVFLKNLLARLMQSNRILDPRRCSVFVHLSTLGWWRSHTFTQCFLPITTRIVRGIEVRVSLCLGAPVVGVTLTRIVATHGRKLLSVAPLCERRLIAGDARYWGRDELSGERFALRSR